MSFPLPRTSVILGYRDLFGTEPPENRMGIIRHISKDHLIAEIAGLNYRLTGRTAKEVDTSFSTQFRELAYFCGGIQLLIDKYSLMIDRISRGKKMFIFTRQSCLYALEEIIQSEIPFVEGFKMGPVNTWESLLLYLLCVNNEVTKVDQGKPDEPVNFETLSPKLLPLSELLLIKDPFYVVHRGLILMEYLAAHSETTVHLSEYFAETYALPYDHFIFELHRMWMGNNAAEDYLNFYYKVPAKDKFKRLFDTLSDRFANDKFYTLVNIRKNPFYNVGNNHYILTDQNILLEKAYNQFINDFWFDRLKKSKRADGKAFSMQDYKSIIGYFFESYVGDLLDYSFKNSKNYIIKKFHELKYYKGKDLKEAGDLYIRADKKIFLAEVKSTSIYDNERYGGNINALYKNDRNKFFKDFGVDQLIANIKGIRDNLQLIDTGLEKRKQVRIWPAIIFNEKAFQAPLMAPVFYARFKELLGDFKDKSIHIYPLTLIHISDLERLETPLHKSPDRFWDLLSSNFYQQIRFIPPFHITLNRNNVKASYDRIMKKIRPLFDKYGPDKNQ
ncbi:hypothetical protein A0256_14325 [Mucilaginibacter sp. PAMC 26640]|nr:hypothetical protein A0256_14325 [Mucilaginibacter sp. PAMC 26640]